MRQFVYDAWNSVMDAKHNPLRHIPDMQVRHMVMQLLAFMWCAAFAVMVGDFMFFGMSLLGHTLLIVAVVVTVATFETAKRKPAAFNFIKGYHSMGRSRGSIWVNGKRVRLPQGDPGGEHE